MLMAGDVGGTYTRLAVYSGEVGPHRPLFDADYRSWDYPDMQSILRRFLAQAEAVLGERATCAVFGIPGPVVDGRATGTNLPWTVDEREIRDALGLEWVRLLNDLEAIAWSVSILCADDLCTLHAGEPDPHGTIAVIAPGTGLGEAFLVWDGERHRPQPSEGGHADFGPNGEEQIELARYLHRQHGHVSYERVCSGRGLPNLYAFLRDTGREAEPDWLAEQVAAAQDPTPTIVAAALEREPPVPLCRHTLDLLIQILAAESGNMALRLLATGGVFLGGGMPRHLLPLIRADAFMATFRAKGRLDYVLDSIPVHVITHTSAGRLGAARRGLQLMSGDLGDSSVSKGGA